MALRASSMFVSLAVIGLVGWAGLLGGCSQPAVDPGCLRRCMAPCNEPDYHRDPPMPNTDQRTPCQLSCESACRGGRR